MKGYMKWVYHGEDETSSDMNTCKSSDDGMDGLLNDMFCNVTKGSSSSKGESDREGASSNAKRFNKLVEEAQQDLYPGCKNFSTLAFTIPLYLLKCMHGWSNASFTSLLELLKETIPMLNIPESFNNSKKMIVGSSRKRTRGATQYKNVHSQSVKDRKLVTFNALGQPVGPDNVVVKELSMFLRTLARNPITCPLVYKSWKKVPAEKKACMWKYVNLKYILPPKAEEWILKDISNSWRIYKTRVKRKYFTRYKNDEQRLKNRPKNIHVDHFQDVLKYWKKKEVKDISDKNTNNRSRLKYMHRAGTTSFTAARHVLKERNENEEEPTRVQVFIETYKSKAGKKSNEEVDNLILQLEETSKHLEQSLEDIFVMTFGKEKPERVHTYGQGVTRSLKQQRQIEDLERTHKNEIESMKKIMDAHTNNVTSKVHAVIMSLKQNNRSLVIDPNILVPLLGESSYNVENIVDSQVPRGEPACSGISSHFAAER